MPNNLSFSMPGYGGGAAGWTGNAGFGGGAPMTMAYPGMGGGGGGGSWLTSAIGGLSGMTPLGMGIGLLGGVLQGIAANAKQNKAIKAYGKQQKAYQAKAAELFPELGKKTFQYSNPQLTNAYQSGLGYMLKNMFGQWGMPKGTQTGLGDIQQMFSGLMQPPQKFAGGGIVTRPTNAIIGERGPEAIIPLQYQANPNFSAPMLSYQNTGTPQQVGGRRMAQDLQRQQALSGEQFHQQQLQQAQQGLHRSLQFHQKMLQQYQQPGGGWQDQMRRQQMGGIYGTI